MMLATRAASSFYRISLQCRMLFKTIPLIFRFDFDIQDYTAAYCGSKISS